MVETYEQSNGRYTYDSDTKSLSLQLAQCNDRDKVNITAKVLRFTGEKWSRQTENPFLHSEGAGVLIRRRRITD